jgi:AhpD family alkylhydroperoxidase
MILDERTLRLIAIGASISANCEACLLTNAEKAKTNGASEIEIAEAIWVGSLVRRGAASKMDRVATRVNKTNPSSQKVLNDNCECG